jgi:hypothetical protein
MAEIRQQADNQDIRHEHLHHPIATITNLRHPATQTSYTKKPISTIGLNSRAKSNSG